MVGEKTGEMEGVAYVVLTAVYRLEPFDLALRLENPIRRDIEPSCARDPGASDLFTRSSAYRTSSMRAMMVNARLSSTRE